MFYAKKTFLTQTTVALLDTERKPITFYTVRIEDINLEDIYIARITEQIKKSNGFFADIGNGRNIYLSTKEPLKVGEKVTVSICKEERFGKIPEGRKLDTPTQKDSPIGLIQKGSFLAGVENESNYTEINWQEEFDDAIEEATETFYSFSDGARLIFENTHAFNCIDVDSHKSLLPFKKINENAAYFIGKEIIRRNLSGNILIDFIGQKRKDELNILKNILSEELQKSPVPYKIIGISPIGNLEIRRRRQRTSIEYSSRQTTTKAFKLFEEIIKKPENIEKIYVPLPIYAILNNLLKETWNTVILKTGEKINLIADPNIINFKIEYKNE